MTKSPDEREIARLRADVRTPITKEFLKSYAEQSLIIDCPIITLTQLATEAPRVIRGAGLISLLDGERFSLRMYPHEGAPSEREHLAALFRRQQGEIIPQNEYYALTARDISGFEWAHDGVLIRCFGGRDRSVITAQFDFLLYQASGLSLDRQPTVKMYFFEDLELPNNQVVDRAVTAGDTVLSRSRGLQRVEKEGERFKIEVDLAPPEEGSTVVNITSRDRPFSTAFPLRVQETLSYVLMKAVQYGISETVQSGKREVILAARKTSISGLMSGPISQRNLELSAHFWNLFERYLAYVSDGDERFQYHALSAQLYPVISNGAAHNLYTSALLTSVAIEGVLNCEFANVGQPSDGYIAEIDRAIGIVRRLRRFQPQVANRAEGAFAAMKTARAKDRLQILKKKQLISREMLDAWVKVRNSAAHASISIDENAIPKLWKRLNIVYTLLNLLVFQAIGFEGNYIDYSIPNWPIRNFRPNNLFE